VRQTAPPLTEAGYRKLVQQGVAEEMSFSSYPPSIFEDTIMMEGGMYMKHDMSVLHEKG
jgi:hypothetical protein